MDYQTLFDLAVGVAAFFGGYSINRLTNSLDRLDDDVREMPMMYVTKEDYRRDIDEIKRICQQIFDKLDDKADKNEF
jgi:hypothetical protein